MRVEEKLKADEWGRTKKRMARRERRGNGGGKDQRVE